ncbi:hypothetical protein [Massilia sp. BKSP1R2A-1]
MNIVCIAWGSLLWKPGPLKLASGWHPAGIPAARACRSNSCP